MRCLCRHLVGGVARIVRVTSKLPELPGLLSVASPLNEIINVRWLELLKNTFLINIAYQLEWTLLNRFDRWQAREKNSGVQISGLLIRFLRVPFWTRRICAANLCGKFGRIGSEFKLEIALWKSVSQRESRPTWKFQMCGSLDAWCFFHTFCFKLEG